MRERLYTVPLLAEVLLIEMPVEKLGQEASPDSETRNRRPGPIPKVAEAKTHLRQDFAVAC